MTDTTKSDNPFDDNAKTDDKPALGLPEDDKAAPKAAPKPKAAAPKAEPKKPRQTKPKKIDFNGKTLSAHRGQVIATIDANTTAAPVLRISLVNWVGTAPLEVLADSIDDVSAVLNDLRKQAS